MMIGFGSLGLSCPSGQVLTNMYNGSQQCCGAPGTPPEADPCSILNNPAFLAAQASDVGPIGANGIPLSSPQFASTSPTNLADIEGYPNNVQQDVITCSMSPGVTFVDSTGISVTCPPETSNENGILVSAYTYGQLAQMLAPGIVTSTPTDLIGNRPFATPAPVAAPAGSSPTAQPTANSPSTTVPSNQIAAAAGGSQSPAAPAASTNSGLDLSFLTNDSLISGFPNWGVAVAVVAGLMILPSLIGGRR